MRWISDSKINVSVWDVEQITKILPSLDGISIEYSIGREDFPRQAYLDETNCIKQIAVLLLVLLCLLIYLSKRLVVSIWRGAGKPKEPE